MCAAILTKGKVICPGKPVGVHASLRPLIAPWTGFARNEIRSWWERRGLIPVDVPAEQFAERSDRDGKLIWAPVPHGLVLRGMCEERNGVFLVRMVTRASLPAELEMFQHPRMPVLACQLPELLLPALGKASTSVMGYINQPDFTGHFTD